MFKSILTGALCAALALAPCEQALAQSHLDSGGGTPNPVIALGFLAVGSPVTLPASSSTNAVQLPAALTLANNELLIANTGAVAAYVALGDSGVQATTASIPVQPGCWIGLRAGSASYIAGITASSTTNLTILAGDGQPTGSCAGAGGGGGGSGGAATLADGASVTFGSKADPKSPATDATAITAMQIWKEISSILQGGIGLTGSLPAFATTPTVQTVDGGIPTVGSKADAKSAASDTTAVTLMSVLKELSYLLQGNGSLSVVNSQQPGAAAPSGSIPVISAILSHASTTALGATLVAKNSAGDLAAFNCTGITGGVAGYCILYNGTAAPSTGALTGANVISFCYFDTTAKGCSLSHLPDSIAMSTGIVIVATVATTPYTYTAGATAAIEADYF